MYSLPFKNRREFVDTLQVQKCSAYAFLTDAVLKSITYYRKIFLKKIDLFLSKCTDFRISNSVDDFKKCATTENVSRARFCKIP